MKCHLFLWLKLYFQHHYSSLQCHMIFRNHSGMFFIWNQVICTVAERAQCAATSENNFRQFDNTHAANAHYTTKQKNALQRKCIWLCCEHLQRVKLQEFFLFAARWALSATVNMAIGCDRYLIKRFIYIMCPTCTIINLQSAHNILLQHKLMDALYFGS